MDYKTELKENILGKIERYFGKTLEEATSKQIYMAVAMTVRDRIMDKWNKQSSTGKSFPIVKSFIIFPLNSLSEGY